MGKRKAPRAKGKPFGVNYAIDNMLVAEERGKKAVKLSGFMTRPAYAHTKAEQKTIFESDKCEACAYYREPDVIGDKECCFPWFDPQDYDEAVFDYLPCQEGEHEER